MNIVLVTNKIKNYSQSLNFVNSTYIGDVYENWNGNPDIKYASINMDIANVTINENLLQMQIVLYYADRLTKLNNNELEIKATAELVLTSIINYMSSIGDVIDGYTINFFRQNFADELAGGYVLLLFETERILGDCLIDEYDDELTLLVTTNGEFDVTKYSKIIVNVPSVTTEEISQEDYDALTEYDPNKIYLILE